MTEERTICDYGCKIVTDRIRVYRAFGSFTAIYRHLYVVTGYNTAIAAINAVKGLYELTRALMHETGYCECDALMSIKYDGYAQHIKQISSGTIAA